VEEVWGDVPLSVAGLVVHHGAPARLAEEGLVGRVLVGCVPVGCVPVGRVGQGGLQYVSHAELKGVAVRGDLRDLQQAVQSLEGMLVAVLVHGIVLDFAEVDDSDKEEEEEVPVAPFVPIP